MADEVLLREGPFPFEKQNASLHHILSLAATQNLHLPTISPYRFIDFMDNALACNTRTNTLPNQHDARKAGAAPCRVGLPVGLS